MSKPYLFSPSEFAFGYSGCKRCYYDLKVNNIRINFGFPTIFSKIDSIQKKFYHNKPSKFLNSNKVPEGIIKTDYAKLHKSEVLYDQKDRAFQLRGKIDAYIDHKNFFSIIDFKVTNINENTTPPGNSPQFQSPFLDTPIADAVSMFNENPFSVTLGVKAEPLRGDKRYKEVTN